MDFIMLGPSDEHLAQMKQREFDCDWKANAQDQELCKYGFVGGAVAAIPLVVDAVNVCIKGLCQMTVPTFIINTALTIATTACATFVISTWFDSKKREKALVDNLMPPDTLIAGEDGSVQEYGKMDFESRKKVALERRLKM